MQFDLIVPVMQDRGAQALVKQALEPEWEAKFEPNVYGFRPGRSCQDAIGAIFLSIRQKPKYVLEGDIAGCFDNISHSALLDKTETPPFIRRLLRGWLKCGVIDGTFQPTERGTPQGGTASPILALIALHGLASHIDSLGTKAYPIQAIFYADDFVVLAAREADIHRAKIATEQWLQGMGLELHPDKTKISHTLEGEAGFEFLGFHIRQYRVGKYASKRGYKTLIKPSKTSEKCHYRQLAKIVSTHQAGTQAKLIKHLNPVIIGWCNYYASVVSKQRFSVLAYRLFNRLMRWARRRHPNLNLHQVVFRYWLVRQGDGWIFQTPDGIKLHQHWETPIRRHTKVRASKSPYDGDWAYWGTRMGYYPELTPLRARLLKQQRGKCSYCGLTFTSEDQIEIHHQDGDHDNSRFRNLTLLHRHCHDQVHAIGMKPLTGTHDKEPGWRGAG
ncbi:MAG: reverse transcriptase domain-containing protein [Cyanobacteria bacterium J06642_11]